MDSVCHESAQDASIIADTPQTRMGHWAVGSTDRTKWRAPENSPARQDIYIYIYIYITPAEYE